MNLTLNLFELHQCLVSLLRKTQNTFSEEAVKKIGWWEFFPKKEICHQTLGHINRTVNLFELHQYIISLRRKIQNTFSEPAVKKISWWECFSKKENLSPNHRSHQQDHESIWITSIPYFLIEKNTKYISEQAVKKIGWWEFFPKKEICHQTLGHINRTVNLFELHQYLISLLRKM